MAVYRMGTDKEDRMAKTSIYLPDELAEQAKAYGVPISELAQAAVRQAVKAAQIKEAAVTNPSAVVDRMQELRRQYAAKVLAKDRAVYEKGAEWARTEASAEALRYAAEWNSARQPDEFKIMESMTWPTGFIGPAEARWDFFQAGARSVWAEIQPLLTEIGEHGEALPTDGGGYAETVSPQYRLWLLREPAADAPSAEQDRWMAEEPEEIL
jgi:post-segregation antitoxin (ccd killing protein)